jgi:small-conductance mechanosensitive channel
MSRDDILRQLTASFGALKQGLVTALPNLITAAVVLLLAWGLAWLLRGGVRRVLRRVAVRIPPGPSREAWKEAVEEQQAGSLAAGGVYWLVLLAGIFLAVDALDLPMFRRWLDALAGYLPELAVSVALVLGGVVLGRLARNAIVRTSMRMPSAQAHSLARLTQASIMVAALLIAAGQLGLDVSFLSSALLIGLAAALGAAALAFGLGARQVMADILAMHYVNKSYRIGQLVRLGSDQGRIMRTTRTAVYLEHEQGELAIPGRHFSDSRCVILDRDESRGA